MPPVPEDNPPTGPLPPWWLIVVVLIGVGFFLYAFIAGG